jgi:serine phosphatase RsbU (regulator of sigma subunit)
VAKSRKKKTKQSLKAQLKGLYDSLKNRYGLTAAIGLSVVVSLIVGGAFLGTYASWTIFEQKQRDTWAIMFLELERHADQLTKKIVNFQTSKISDKAEVYRIQRNNDVLINIRASTLSAVTLKDFGLTKPQLTTDWNLLQRGGETFLAKITNRETAQSLVKKELKKGSYLALWPIDFAKWVGNNLPQENKVYAITREGSLLFTNQPGINAGNVVLRKLVQKFVKNPVSQGQFEFKNRFDEETYGFVQELPQTNVVLFSETSVSEAFSGMERILWRFGFVIGITLLISLLVIYIPISKVVKTIQSLTRHALQVASGEFSGGELKTGFGELGILTSAFNRMRKSLVQRDKAIELLIEEQKTKVRLEGEVEIAQTIQRNLLSADDIPEKAKVTLATLYIPAEECAGDWYTYFYDEETNEMMMIIADVSGHGTGSSMFTAIIAGITEQMRARPGKFDIDAYVQDVNHVLGKLGRKEWHATMLVGRFYPGSDELELVNCGQSFPCIVYPEGSKHKSGNVRMPSMVLGVDPVVETARKVVPFEPGSQILMYTDGLEEARGASGKQFGRKKIHKICLSTSDSPKKQIGMLHSEWNSHLGDEVADDDMCLMSVRAV